MFDAVEPMFVPFMKNETDEDVAVNPQRTHEPAATGIEDVTVLREPPDDVLPSQFADVAILYSKYIPFDMSVEDVKTSPKPTLSMYCSATDANDSIHIIASKVRVLLA
jgi:hypothetical protein